jgi:hypothetical protein
MVSILSLWLPILLSAIAVFLVSSIIHMVLTYHRSNFSPIPDEQAFRDSVRPLNIAPGEYMFPHCSSPKAMETEEFQSKMNEGPVGMMTVMPNGPFAMGKNLMMWFLYSLIVGVFVAYICTLTLAPSADYLKVMQLAGATAFGGYSLALMQNSVWNSRPWSTTFKFMFDGLVYALLTGGMFGWLWPAL